VTEEKRVIVTLNLPPLQAIALAKLAKRITWKELRQSAQDHEEAYDMSSAVEELKDALAAAGNAMSIHIHVNDSHANSKDSLQSKNNEFRIWVNEEIAQKSRQHVALFKV
jgi:hypothetical protein